MKTPATVADADIVLMEGTYGNRCHRNLQNTIDQLEQILRDTW